MGLSTEPFVVPASDLIINRARIIGSLQIDREYLYEALDFVAKGKVTIMIENYQLDDIASAYEKVANGEVRFRSVVTM